MLDPQAKALLERVAAAGRPTLDTLSPPDAREEYRRSRRALHPEPPEVASVDNLSIPGPHGPIGARAYRALGTQASELLPALVYFHGGGYTVGDLDTHDVVCRSLANEARCAVISIDYRLGPEHKFPAAVDDCVAATRWVAAQAATLRIDADRVAVGGDSAGGNLATVTALIVRDRGAPKLVFQMLIYPGTHPPHRTRSAERLAKGYLLTRDLINYFRSNYVRGPEDFNDWRCSPLIAPDVSRLPPALIITAGYDPLVDEGKAYADRLAAAGVPVTYKCYEGMVHGFINMGKVLDAANVAFKECGAALAQTFTRTAIDSAIRIPGQAPDVDVRAE
jgi:acetyl esterase